jgi:hypothetical protein
MCLLEKWREPEISALPECTRIFLSPCLSVISVTIFCALTLIIAYSGPFLRSHAHFMHRKHGPEKAQKHRPEKHRLNAHLTHI